MGSSIFNTPVTDQNGDMDEFFQFINQPCDQGLIPI